MTTASLVMDEEKTSARKRPKLRRIIGIALIVLVVVCALVTTVSMRQKIEAADEAAKPILQRALQNDLIVFVAALFVAIGIAFDVLTGVRNRVVKVIGYIIWGAAIAVTAETLLFSATVVVDELRQEDSSDAAYVMVLGAPLEGNNSVPGKLAAQLGTAENWWRNHPDTMMIVTGSGKATKTSNKKNDLAGLSITANKSAVDIIGAALMDKGVPEESILKIGRSDSDEQSFENLLKNDEVAEDTPIMVVIDNFDMNRTANLAEQAGFTAITPLPATPSFWESGTVLLWKVWNAFDPEINVEN
ncbi:MAG: YdcF family protein [Clostridia bacterium]|nr:YdcF family protein [Clostridia bacterium]